MIAFQDYFSIQVFFLIFRETLETAVIVSVLLAFLKRGLSNDKPSPSDGYSSIDNTDNETVTNSPTISSADNSRVYRQLVLQVWIGAALGLFICLVIGSLFIFAFYYLGTNLWNVTERIWEATFSILASLIITGMGLTMLRINKMKEKWRLKLAKIIIDTHEGHAGWGLSYFSRKYAMAILPLITTLREGLEAVVFLGGVGVSNPISSFPLAVITAIALGSYIGYCMYQYGSHVSIQYFLIGSTCFLYLVAAGLISRGVWFLELESFIKKVGVDISENGSGPGSYDITNSVWHVNCCNGQTDGLWMLFNALFGWQNSATYGSVISYNLYWYVVIISIVLIRYKEVHNKLPLIPESWTASRKHKQLHSTASAEDLLNRATALYTANNSEVSSVAPGAPRPSHDSVHSDSPLIR
ncbi:Fth1p [Sugiyamaella lignohabitans]|uniref:Fth1p n=1 Tax=Sugiyamaella lignohabitans TaxID=796027 RepID=A0A161HKM8_9ASCO|nr:Fth1p [Sugiyamaella lignohabitans]ANB13607.1 Fth1p [Sugiyamaella lignohabitans]